MVSKIGKIRCGYISKIRGEECIVGKGVHTPLFLDQLPPPPFLRLPLSRNPRCPTFYMPIRKTNVLKDSFNRFVYNFYPQSILILEEYLRKW